ncbi:hypothetical protein O7626_23220 [Micromonospora sp. WMMD1102]|uniref:hypothetical protein n=1 Tax=Micromonospora sp. WMMD1102 TaxID=3016105 RepID=UPI0024151F95|nr:hypothetical protein [Micromonospora sp. WMMD1102]MDG4788800.1 hypothetical protein [Micromonospora sp. WMMD1102]
MTLNLCPDVSAADWLTQGHLPWQQLVLFGPAGFDTYARLRLLPDPIRPGQSENDVEADDWRTRTATQTLRNTGRPHRHRR